MKKVTLLLIYLLLTSLSYGNSRPHPNKMYVKRLGDTIYIGTKFDEKSDLLICFRKCLNNNLMGFYQVGIAANTTDSPLTDVSRNPDKVINLAYSDNIGPISIEGNFCGANHCYKEDYTKKIKTATCDWFTFTADGKPLDNNRLIACNEVQINVVNTIYNPLLPTYGADGTTVISLDSVLCLEKVEYRVAGGSISVNTEHTYVQRDPVKVTTYYGMQSMAKGDEIYFPGGSTADFVKKQAGINNPKSAYPELSSWIQRDSAGSWYEACWMNPSYELGKRALITEDNNMAFTSGTKVYHRLINGQVAKKGTINKWSGCYTWFTPLIDNDRLLCYEMTYNGGNYLFIQTKKAVSTVVDLPAGYTNHVYSVWHTDKTQSATTHSGKAPIKLVSKGPGTTILKIEN